jgi:hypothetical protein
LLQPRYRAFIAPTDRSVPALCIGTLASRFSPLVLLPCHQSPGSCSSTQKPASGSRPLYASHRLPSHQAPDRLVPVGIHAAGFDDAKFLYDASSVGLLSLVSRTHTCSGSCPELFFQCSRPRLLPAAAWSGLRPAPESRSRGARPHLPRSCTTGIIVSCSSFPSVSAAHRSQGSRRSQGTRTESVRGSASGEAATGGENQDTELVRLD